MKPMELPEEGGIHERFMHFHELAQEALKDGFDPDVYFFDDASWQQHIQQMTSADEIKSIITTLGETLIDHEYSPIQLHQLREYAQLELKPLLEKLKKLLKPPSQLQIMKDIRSGLQSIGISLEDRRKSQIGDVMTLIAPIVILIRASNIAMGEGNPDSVAA